MKEQEALKSLSETQGKVNVLEQKKNSLESQFGVVEARLKAVEQKERTAREALANAQEKERFADNYKHRPRYSFKIALKLTKDLQNTVQQQCRERQNL